MNRRTFLAAAAAGVAVPLAGCVGDGEYNARPASIPEATLADAGYDGEAPESFTIDAEFEVAGNEIEVEATTWTATYANPDRQSSLVVASTPDAEVLGQSVNPLVRASDAELLHRLLERASDESDLEVDDVEAERTETRRILGEEVEVTTFAVEIEASVDDAGAAAGDGTVPGRVHLATVPHDGDVIVLVGIHPEAVDERETVLELMGAVEH